MKRYLFLILLLPLMGCSVTKEVSTRSEETTKIQEIAVKPPDVEHTIIAPIVPKKDSANSQVEEYESIIPSTVIDKKDGTEIKSTVKKTKVIIHKDTKQAEVQIQLEQEVKADAKVTETKTITNSNIESKPFYVDIFNRFYWLFILAIIIGIIVLILKYKGIIK